MRGNNPITGNELNKAESVEEHKKKQRPSENVKKYLKSKFLILNNFSKF